MATIIPDISSKGLLGDLRTYAKDPLAYLHNNFQQHGDIFRFRVLHRTLVTTNNPDHVQHILQENNRNYRKSLAYRKLGVVLGNGLLTSEGDFWLRQRRMSAPAFHKGEIAAYEQIMLEETQLMMDSWDIHKPINLTTAMTQLTLKINARTLLGLSLEDKVGKTVEEILPPGLKFMIKRITSPINSPLWLPTRNNREFNRSMKLLHQIIEELIHMKEQQPGDDLLSVLLRARDDEGKGMTHQQLHDEVLTFFLAGHETTAVAASWTIWLLKTHPAVERKLRTALGTPDEAAYLQAIIQESMRLLSPVWIIGREAMGDDLLGDFKINNGDSVIFSSYLIQRRHDLWENAEDFLPERWLEGKPLHKYAYFPFGGGPRLCIGNHFALQELGIIIKALFSRFQFDLEDLSFPGADYTLTLRPKRPLMARLSATSCTAS